MPKRKPRDSGSVMAGRAAKDANEGLTEEERRWKMLDFFPTPPWAARAGAEILRELCPDALFVREPACGAMHMAGPLAEYFVRVLPSDVFPHGPDTPVIDWLDDAAWPSEPDCDLIVTNPPFALAERFVHLGLKRARLGVALLLRTAFVESAGRHALFCGEAPVTQLAFFTERVPMTLGKWDPASFTATSYTWFIWLKDRAPLPPRWIGPGTKERLWRPEDAARYGWAPPMALFPEDFDVL